MYSHTQSAETEAYNCRSMLRERSQNQGGMNNFQLLTSILPRLRQSGLSFRLQFSNRQLFQTLYQCDEEDLQLVLPDMSLKPSPSPLRGVASDPFAALDSKPPSASVDEISNRFPSLDQFSLLHDGAAKFDFDASSPTKPTHSRDISQRVTEKLADDAFAIPAQTKAPAATHTLSPPGSTVSRAQKIISSNPELQPVASAPPAIVYQPTPTRSTNNYVSQGTMTSPLLDSQFPHSKIYSYCESILDCGPIITDRQAFREIKWQVRSSYGQKRKPSQSGSIPRNSSYGSQLGHVRHASSSRPSLESSRPSNDLLEPIVRTKSSSSRPRPTSTYLESNMDYLREKESSGRTSLSLERAPSYSKETAVVDLGSDDETNIESNVDFLRTMEDQDSGKKDRRRSSGTDKKGKRSSLPSMSLSGTKNLLAGKFGDAFKRFEHSASSPPGPRTPSPLHDLERRDLTPIAGSEATDGRKVMIERCARGTQISWPLSNDASSNGEGSPWKKSAWQMQP